MNAHDEKLNLNKIIFGALYQMTVVYGGRHLVRVFPGAPGYVVSSIWLHLISLVTTVD